MTTDQIVNLAMNERALQRPGELAQLVDLVLDLQPKSVLEIGTCHGGTLAAWCQCAAPDARIVSVDLPGGEFGGGYHQGHAQHLRTLARAGQQLWLHQGDSHSDETRFAVAAMFHPAGLDFLFIDGDHTYEGVKADFEFYSRLVRPGGLIALHDVVPYPEDPRCGVDRFWDETEPLFERTWKFRTPGEYLGCGIGVIEWPG